MVNKFGIANPKQQGDYKSRTAVRITNSSGGICNPVWQGELRIPLSLAISAWKYKSFL